MEADMGDDALIDIEAYANNYTGNAKINRLVFISEKTADAGLALSALRIAAEELKKGQNTSRYEEVLQRMNGRLGQHLPLDRSWVETVDTRAQATQYRLESELSGYKTNLIKESIRMGHHDLADFFYARGDLQSAFKSYVRTRDYCTTSKQVINMCLAVMKCAIELGNFTHVNAYITKAEHSPDSSKDTVTQSKLKAASGLAALDAKKYRLAGKKLTEVLPELGSHYSDVMAAQDVALYGGLCALASFDRSEIKRNVVESIGFREMLEVNPEIREVVYDFYGSKYASCLARLQRMLPVLRLDIFLSPHVEALYKAVRCKALIQYTTPFVSVNLHTMADAFGTDVGVLEKELADLISSGEVQARIDSHAKVLYARLTDARAVAYDNALKFEAELLHSEGRLPFVHLTERQLDCLFHPGEEYLRNTHAQLLRVSLLQHDLVQRGAPAAPQGQRQGRGQHGSDRQARFGETRFNEERIFL